MLCPHCGKTITINTKPKRQNKIAIQTYGQEKTPTPPTGSPWHFQKRYFDRGETVSYQLLPKGPKTQGVITKVHTNNSGRVSYSTAQEPLILLEDITQTIDPSAPVLP